MNTTHLKHGVYGGLAGGIVFGALMGMMGMLPMIGAMIGVPSALAGMIVHLFISAGIGGAFGLLIGTRGEKRPTAVAAGTAYGALWWILGPLTLMPFFMGMGLGTAWNLEAAAQALPSLVGHLLFGAVLGFTYAGLTRRSESDRRESEVVPSGRVPARGS